MNSANKDMADSLSYWGGARLDKYGVGVAATDWDGVSDKKMKEIEKATDSIARKIVKRNSRIKPGLKTRIMFWIMHLVQRKGWNERDVNHWKEKGWTEKKRPWKE